MKREHRLLFLLFLFVLGFRIYFAFQTENFSSDEAYFHIRHTDFINLNLKPMVYDELSYGGRTIINSHVYHYFLSFFNAFHSIIAFKLIPEILLSLLVIAVYFIAESITKNPLASLLSAFSSAFVPIFLKETLNQVSIFSVILPLFLYQFYCMLNLDKKINHFLVISFILPLIHPIGFLFSIMLIVYILLLEIDYTTPEPLTREAVLFSVLIGLLVNLIIYKRVFLDSGLYAVWQDIPAELITSYFKNVNVFDIMLNIGVVTSIFGIIGLLIGIYKQRSRINYLLSAMIVTAFMLLFLRMINFQTGIMFLGILIAIIASIGFERLIKYIELTKFIRAKTIILSIVFLFLVATTLVPSYFSAQALVKDTISEKEIEALQWIKENTGEDSTVLADVNEGNYIMWFAQRKNVLDSLFILVPDRYDDVKLAFTTQSLVKALDVFEEYNVDYVYLSNRTYDLYNKDAMKYINDACFRKRFENEMAKVYRVLC